MSEQKQLKNYGYAQQGVPHFADIMLTNLECNTLTLFQNIVDLSFSVDRRKYTSDYDLVF